MDDKFSVCFIAMSGVTKFCAFATACNYGRAIPP